MVSCLVLRTARAKEKEMHGLGFRLHTAWQEGLHGVGWGCRLVVLMMIEGGARLWAFPLGARPWGLGKKGCTDLESKRGGSVLV